MGLSRIGILLLLFSVLLFTSIGMCYVTHNLAVKAPESLQEDMLYGSSLYCVLFVGAFLVLTVVTGLVRLVMVFIPRSR